MDTLNVDAQSSAVAANALEWDGGNIADLLSLTPVGEGRFCTGVSETN
jgi:hypothetical protein